MCGLGGWSLVCFCWELKDGQQHFWVKSLVVSWHRIRLPRPQVWDSRIIAHLQTRAEAARGHSRAHCVAHNMKARTQACFHTKHCCLTLFFSMTRAESRLQKPSDEWVVFHSFTHSISDAAPRSRDLTFHVPPYGKASESVEIAHFRFWNAVAYIIQQCTPNIICGKAGRSAHVIISSPVICAMWLQLKIYNQKKVILAEETGERRRQSCETRMWLGLLLFWVCRPHLVAKLSSGLQCSIQRDRPLPSACSSRHNIRKVLGVSEEKKTQNKTKWMPGQENWLLCFFATLVMQESCQPPLSFKFSV